MLELGKAGSAGAEKGVLPVLRDGAVVATLRASNWKEAATAVVGDREWVFAKHKRELTGRWAAEPEDAVRLRRPADVVLEGHLGGRPRGHAGRGARTRRRGRAPTGTCRRAGRWPRAARPAAGRRGRR